jgi:hypothetical protein
MTLTRSRTRNCISAIQPLFASSDFSSTTIFAQPVLSLWKTSLSLGQATGGGFAIVGFKRSKPEALSIVVRSPTSITILFAPKNRMPRIRGTQRRGAIMAQTYFESQELLGSETLNLQYLCRIKISFSSKVGLNQIRPTSCGCHSGLKIVLLLLHSLKKKRKPSSYAERD